MHRIHHRLCVCLPLHYLKWPFTPGTRSCQLSCIPASLRWTRKRGLLETSELASRLILLIQISSLGNCCIDWTTKAWRKTLQHSIIHTDRHNAILLLPLFLPPPSPFLFPPVSLLIPISSPEELGKSEEGSRQTSRCWGCVCVCVSVIWSWSYLWARAG